MGFGIFGSNKTESTQQVNDTVKTVDEEYECGECSTTYSTQKEAEECCATDEIEVVASENTPINYEDYIAEHENILIFDLESFSDDYTGDEITLELCKAINYIYNKGYTTKILIDCQNNGNQGEIVFEKKLGGI